MFTNYWVGIYPLAQVMSFQTIPTQFDWFCSPISFPSVATWLTVAWPIRWHLRGISETLNQSVVGESWGSGAGWILGAWGAEEGCPGTLSVWHIEHLMLGSGRREENLAVCTLGFCFLGNVAKWLSCVGPSNLWPSKHNPLVQECSQQNNLSQNSPEQVDLYANVLNIIGTIYLRFVHTNKKSFVV